MRTVTSRQQQIELLERSWAIDPRWRVIERNYTAHDVVNLRGSIQIEYTLARMGANRLWEMLQTEDYVHALGALSGNQAMQMVRAGLKAIYLNRCPPISGEDLAGQTFAGWSPYSALSAPQLVKNINHALRRADQLCHAKGEHDLYWFAPIVTGAEAGGTVDTFVVTKALIEAGAAGIHFEDQLAFGKKGGVTREKVLVPTGHFIKTLNAARLAADALGVPTLLIARTDAGSAGLIVSDIDQRDQEFLTGERTPEGYYRVTSGLKAAIARGLAYAPYVDLIWHQTSTPDLDEARQFAEAIHAKFPGKMLAYNCSASFDWGVQLDDVTLAKFQEELGANGYKFQFVASAGFHALNVSMFELASGYRDQGMAAYVKLQKKELEFEARGYASRNPEPESGTGYLDMVQDALSESNAFVAALPEAAAETQFEEQGQTLPEMTV